MANGPRRRELGLHEFRRRSRVPFSRSLPFPAKHRLRSRFRAAMCGQSFATLYRLRILDPQRLNLP